MAEFPTNACGAICFTKFASYKLPPVMVSTHGSVVPLAMFPLFSFGCITLARPPEIHVFLWPERRDGLDFDCEGKRSDQTPSREDFFAFPQISGCPLVWGRVQSRMSEDRTKRGVKAGVKVTTEKLSRVRPKERGSRNVDMSIKPCSPLNLPFYFC